MELYFIIGMLAIGTLLLLSTVFINIFIEELKKEEDNIGYIEGMIVFRN